MICLKYIEINYIFLVLILYKVFFKPKKKKANELKEDIDYTNVDKNENALGI